MSIYSGMPHDYPLSLQSHYVAKEIMQCHITKTYFYFRTIIVCFFHSSCLIEQISTHKK